MTGGVGCGFGAGGGTTTGCGSGATDSETVTSHWLTFAAGWSRGIAWLNSSNVAITTPCSIIERPQCSRQLAVLDFETDALKPQPFNSIHDDDETIQYKSFIRSDDDRRFPG